MNILSNYKYKKSDVIKTHDWLLVCKLPVEGDKTNDMNESFKTINNLGYKAAAYLRCNVP